MRGEFFPSHPKERTTSRKRAVALVSGVVSGGERSYPQKRAQQLLFGGCGWWWWPKKGQTPENERDGSFSGIVGGSGCQGEVNLPKTSRLARFRELWVVVVAKEKSTSRKRAVALVFGGCGWW
jgi:hypothetical protein